MPAAKLLNPNRVNIHGILFERGIPRYVTSDIAAALEEDERFEIIEGEDNKGGVKIKRAMKAKPIEPDQNPDEPDNPDSENSSNNPVIEV